MILRLFARFRRYPNVLATLVVAAVAGTVAHALGGACSLAAGGLRAPEAARSAWRMLRELRSGTFGVDILAVTAIGASVVVGEAWAAPVIVLMLTGGEALEDYAANRAKRDLTTLLARAPQTEHRLAADGTLNARTLSRPAAFAWSVVESIISMMGLILTSCRRLPTLPASRLTASMGESVSEM